MKWHGMTAAQTAAELKTDLKKGLTDSQSALRLRQHGENKLSEGKKKGLASRFFLQFADFMVIILLIAAAISFATSLLSGDRDYIDSVVILAIVVMNAAIGAAQETRAQKALDMLKNLSAPQTIVIRGGRRKQIKTSGIVPGDIICLTAGDIVPADARIIEASGVKTQESALTGESMPSEKNAPQIFAEKCSPGDMKNMLFSSTVVLTGHCSAVVVETGMDTQIGKIAGLLNSEEAPRTPLQIRLAKVSRLLGVGALVICGFIFVMGLMNRTPVMDSFMLSISLAVAAIPEGLPAIVTIVLSVGVSRMAKSNAIVRRLPTVETLGAATVICSDKTGTLTQNRMTVTEVYTASGPAPPCSAEASELLAMAALCCNSSVTGSRGKLSITGDPTENAIVAAADAAGTDVLRAGEIHSRVSEIPFDSSRKMMTVVYRTPSGFRQVTKGAPDILMARCSRIRSKGAVEALSDFRRGSLLSQNEKMAAAALRVIAVAYRDLPSAEDTNETNMIFAGFIGMTDPPRHEAYEAVNTCKSAGIKPVMITGDHIKTARAVAKQLGIADSESDAVTGNEIDKMDDDSLRKAAEKCSVFARVTPAHKVRIVKAFRESGGVVAMTGDGVNDAPALKAADIGCAMGKSGTDVAKEAADMILTDDNFATIVKAVTEGRGIYDNIKKAVHFLLSCNIGEILVILAAVLLKLPTPLLPIQLLWVNLVTDSLPAMALGVERKEKDIMKRRPYPPDEGFFSGSLGLNIAVEGAMIGALTLLAFVVGRHMFGATLELGRTMAFTTLSFIELIHALSVRSGRSIFKIGLFSNMKMIWAVTVCAALQAAVVTFPALASIFKTVPLNGYEWLAVIALAFVPFTVIEIEKLFKRQESGKIKSSDENKTRQNRQPLKKLIRPLAVSRSPRNRPPAR